MIIVCARSVQYKICLSPGDMLDNCLYGDGAPEKLKYLIPASGILKCSLLYSSTSEKLPGLVIIHN